MICTIIGGMGRGKGEMGGDGNLYGDSGILVIDEMEEKGISGLEIGGASLRTQIKNSDEDEEAENEG